jgi:methylated-DNA-[protein]-cysteine S-methyltransferase
MYVLTTPTPDGLFHLLMDDEQVVRASGFGSLAALQTRLPLELRAEPLLVLRDHEYLRQVAAYYAGDHEALGAIAYKQSGSAFQQQVWASISDIAYGGTLSYKQLADAVGKPAAVRAAGTACGQNRLILLVPCHRVLKSDGSLGNYLYGQAIKASLLKREGAY